MASKPESLPQNNVDDDFVVLQKFENMADSGASSASTIPEKHTFETLEKLSDNSSARSATNEKPKGLDSFDSLTDSSDFSSLGDSRINDMPYYESLRFIDKQLEKEKKLGFSLKGSEREKVDELCGEKGRPVLNNKSGEGDEAQEKGRSLVDCPKGQERIEEGDEEGCGARDESIIQGHGSKGDQSDVGMSGGNVEGSWMYVEGDEGASSEGEGTAMGIMDRDKQEKGKVGDKEMNKHDGPGDGESVSKAHTNLVGEGIEKDGKGENVEAARNETKAEKKGVDTTDQTSHIEDTPCDEQTDIAEEHLSGADVIPADKNMQSENGKYIIRTDKKNFLHALPIKYSQYFSMKK